MAMNAQTENKLAICNRWIEDNIERLSQSRTDSEIEAIRRQVEKDTDYSRGLSKGCAIADNSMLVALRGLRDKLRDLATKPE